MSVTSPGPDACTLFQVQRFSTEDGPGIRTTLFFKGCPLRCPWCHNPEGIESRPAVAWQSSRCLACGDCTRACPEGAIRLDEDGVHIDPALCQVCQECVAACPSGALEALGSAWRAEELLEEVLRDKTFYEASGGGVSLSGGEPLMQHAFVRGFAKRCREAGLHVALDTCGFAPRERFSSILSQVDLVLFDLKLMDPNEHRRLTGVPLDTVLDNLDQVAIAGLPLWVRTPVIPGATDTDENLRAIASHLAKRAPTLERFDLLAFSNYCTAKYGMLGMDFQYMKSPLLTPERMEALTGLCRGEGLDKVRWSGPTRNEPEAP